MSFCARYFPAESHNAVIYLGTLGTVLKKKKLLNLYLGLLELVSTEEKLIELISQILNDLNIVPINSREKVLSIKYRQV